MVTRPHGCLYRLIISADSESTEIPLEIDTPPSPCVCPSSLTRFSVLIFRSKHTRSPPAHALAGVDDLLTKCHDFGKRMFALYEAGAVVGRMSSILLCSDTTSDPTIVSGLLITGRAGAGKTSIVQATSKALQWDPHVHACK